MTVRILCEVFSSPNKEGMYLYVKREEGLSRVPQNLLTVFGTPASALVIMLEPERKLAIADAKTVLSALENEGFYVQMPPGALREAALDPAHSWFKKDVADAD